MNPSGIRRLCEIAAAAEKQQPLSREEVLAVLAHLQNTGRQMEPTRVGDLFGTALVQRGQDEVSR